MGGREQDKPEHRWLLLLAQHPKADLERRLPRSSPTACPSRILPTAPSPSLMNPGEWGAEEIHSAWAPCNPTGSATDRQTPLLLAMLTKEIY